MLSSFPLTSTLFLPLLFTLSFLTFLLRFHLSSLSCSLPSFSHSLFALPSLFLPLPHGFLTLPFLPFRFLVFLCSNLPPLHPFLSPNPEYCLTFLPSVPPRPLGRPSQHKRLQKPHRCLPFVLSPTQSHIVTEIRFPRRLCTPGRDDRLIK